jgi:hypothetical protein
MPNCEKTDKKGKLSCGHCVVVSVMVGRENTDHWTNSKVEKLAQEAGLKEDMALPNDHSRPEMMDDWCTTPTNCECGKLAPNRRPYCDAHCWHGKNIFWSWVEHLGVDAKGKHEHTKPNRYRVAEVLYWCDGTRASASTVIETNE